MTSLQALFSGSGRRRGTRHQELCHGRPVRDWDFAEEKRAKRGV